MPEPSPENVNRNTKAASIGRRRRKLAWTLVAPGLLVAAVWAASGHWGVFYRTPSRTIMLVEGFVSVTTSESPLPLGPGRPAGWSVSTFAEYHWPWQHGWWPVVNVDRTLGYPPAPAGVSSTPVSQVARSVTLWAVCAGLLVPAALLLWGAAAARRRAMRGICTACGYDLAGLAAGSPCPECGRGPK